MLRVMKRLRKNPRRHPRSLEERYTLFTIILDSSDRHYRRPQRPILTLREMTLRRRNQRKPPRSLAQR